MSIISLDGELGLSPYQATSSTFHFKHKTRRSLITFSPQTFSDKWNVPKNGFYTPTDVTFVVTPHISEKAGVMATVKLIDVSDLSPSRVLYESKPFNLGHGLTLEGSQLPFCLPVGEYPIAFEVTVSRSQYLATRTMFSTSLDWRMMWSPTPLSRVKSVFAEATQPVMEAAPTFNMKLKGTNKSSVAQRKEQKRIEQPKTTRGGTVIGLVTDECVGRVEEA